MFGQDKTIRSILIIGLAFIGGFALLIFLVNIWVGRSLEEAQKQIAPVTSGLKTEFYPQREVKIDTFAKKQGQEITDSNAVVDKAVSQTMAVKEAPILDKILDE